MMANLYELTEKYERLMDLENDADPEAFADALENITDDLTTKVENYAKVDHQMQSDIKQLKEEKDRLTKKIKTIQNNKIHLRNNLLNSMTLTNTTKIRTKDFSISIQKNKNAMDINEQELPAWLFTERIVRTPDKERINELLTDGKAIPGANLRPESYHVVIR